MGAYALSLRLSDPSPAKKQGSYGRTLFAMMVTYCAGLLLTGLSCFLGALVARPLMRFLH